MTKNNVYIILKFICIVGFISACSNDEVPLSPTHDTTFHELSCDVLTPSTFQCVNIPNGVLLQTQDANQHVITLESTTITFDDTLYLDIANQSLTIAPLQGTSVISIDGITRILQAGLQIALPIDIQADNTLHINTFSSEATPFTLNISTNHLFQLERTIALPNPLVTPAPTTNQNNTLSNNNEPDCVIPEGWSGFYTVQPGDTLSAIAQTHDVTLTELQEANCIVNINVLNPDDVLRVPQEQIIVDVTFTASPDTLNTGDCTQLTWEADLASVVYLDGDPVSRNGTQEICPPATRTYTLLVVSPDGSQVGYTTTVTMQSE